MVIGTKCNKKVVQLSATVIRDKDVADRRTEIRFPSSDPAKVSISSFPLQKWEHWRILKTCRYLGSIFRESGRVGNLCFDRALRSSLIDINSWKSGSVKLSAELTSLLFSL